MKKKQDWFFIDISGRDNSRWIYCFYLVLTHAQKYQETGGAKETARSRGSVEYRVCDLACLCVQYVSLAPRLVDAHVET